MGRASSRETIMVAATRLFAEGGFNDTSMSEVAERAGVVEGTIFYHFKTKEDLFLEILGRIREDVISEYHAFRDQETPSRGIDMVANAVAFFLYLAGKMEQQFLLLHSHFPFRLAVSNQACREHLEAIFSCFVEIFEDAIEVGCADGSVAELPPRKMALLVFSMVDSLVRFRSFNLYDPAALHNEMMAACRRMLMAVEEDEPCG